MRKARNRFERVSQVFNWLIDEFEFDREVILKWVKLLPRDKESPAGYCGMVVGYENGDTPLEIRLCKTACREASTSLESMIHEAAHAYLWEEGLGFSHGPKFWPVYGEFKDAFDHHGDTDSRSYPFT